MGSLLAYEVLGLRDFLTVVFGLVSDLPSVFPLDSLAVFLATAGRGRTGLGFTSTALAPPMSEAGSAGAAAGAAALSSSALGAGLGGAFFTFFAARTSSAVGAGGATGWSPLAITSPLYTQHLMPITP